MKAKSDLVGAACGSVVAGRALGSAQLGPHVRVDGTNGLQSGQVTFTKDSGPVLSRMDGPSREHAVPQSGKMGWRRSAATGQAPSPASQRKHPSHRPHREALRATRNARLGESMCIAAWPGYGGTHPSRIRRCGAVSNGRLPKLPAKSLVCHASDSFRQFRRAWGPPAAHLGFVLERRERASSSTPIVPNWRPTRRKAGSRSRTLGSIVGSAVAPTETYRKERPVGRSTCPQRPNGIAPAPSCGSGEARHGLDRKSMSEGTAGSTSAGWPCDLLRQFLVHRGSDRLGSAWCRNHELHRESVHQRSAIIGVVLGGQHSGFTDHATCSTACAGI